MSGVKTTIYGATGSLGGFLSTRLGNISSDIIYPIRNRFWWDDGLKDLRCHGSTGMSYISHDTQFDDFRNLERVNRHADVIINMIGPSRYYNFKLETYKEVNMNIPRNIARSARLMGTKKLIHFSACGADPKSPSMDLQTKFYGEEMVRDEFPDAIIIRPTTILSRKDYYMQYIYRMIDYWTSFIPVFNDCSALRQPISVEDFMEAIVSVIKMDNINGKTFEIGGPFVYTHKEIMEMMMTALDRPVRLAHINPKWALKVSEFIGFRYYNREDIIKSGIDSIVKQENGEYSIEDLFVQPGSIAPYIKTFCFKNKDPVALLKEETEH